MNGEVQMMNDEIQTDNSTLDTRHSEFRRKRVLIVGAVGMDYHVFNTVFRDNEQYEVVGFTMAAEQNLGTIAGGRPYPASLAGKLYPNGIPTFSENDLGAKVRELKVDEVVFAYSDIKYRTLMNLAAEALAAGADWRLVAPRLAQLKSKRPVIAVCAVRTGCGKSQTSRRAYEIITGMGLKTVAVREPMPYGDLEKMVWQRFASYEDLANAGSTIEEREEYEPYIENGMVIYAGVDYAEILRHAEEESDVIVFDGGNNEISFFKPDLLIVVTDPLRAGHGTAYHPGEVNLRMADVVVINKEDTATPEQVATVEATIQAVNPRATVVHADSPLEVADPDAINGKRVLVVEDGPTLTHGEMPYGAGMIAAKQFEAGEVVDPAPVATGTIKATLEKFSHIKNLLPAMGYHEQQLKDMQDSINAVDCDLVLLGTPIDLRLVVKIEKPAMRVFYDLADHGEPTLAGLIKQKLS